MDPLPRSAFERALRGLSAAGFVRFVAALWEARGWETSIDGDAIVAEREGDRRVLLVRHAVGWRSLRTRWTADRDDVTDVVTSAPGAHAGARNLATALDARCHGRDDLYELALYGLDRETADRLFREHLGRPARRTDSGGLRDRLGAFSGGGTVALAAGILTVVALAVALGGPPAAPGGQVDATPTPADPVTFSPTPTATPMPTPRPPAGNATVATGRDSWPMFRGGPDHAGVNERAAGPAAPAVRSVDLDAAVLASPAITNGAAYVGTIAGRLYALNATTLASTWERRVGGSVTTSPAVVDGVVYAGSANQFRSGSELVLQSVLQAIDPAAGEVRWGVPGHPITVDDPETSTAIGPASSPAVVDGTAYAGSLDGRIYAIDAARGTIRWMLETEGPIRSSPAVVDGTVYVGSGDGHVYAIDAARGTVRWRVDTGAPVVSSPAVANGTVYVGNDDGRLYAVDTGTGAVTWTRSTGGPVRSSPAVANGTLYVGSDDGHLYAVAADGGRIRWRVAANASIVASPAVANGTVYVGDLEGRLYAVDAATGRVRWRLPLGGRLISSPAVVGRTVYVGSTDGRLYAVGGETV